MSPIVRYMEVPMNRWDLILVVFIAFLITIPLAAQLKVDVPLVNVVATVTDDRGRYVPELLADDLILEEDGVVQKISHFDQDDDLPVSVGITLDTSGSMERKMGTAAGAVERF